MSNDLYIMHYGVGHDKGGHSGRYPWGSGKNPKQDLGTLKRGIRKDIRKAKGKTSKLEGKHPAFMTETYASILADAGIFTTFGAARKKNRPAVKAAIERRYNNDPNFRAKVKEARKYWIDAGKKAEKNAQAYVKYYEKSEYTPKEVGKAKAYVDYIKNNIDKRVGNNDIDFATNYLFDDKISENRDHSVGAVGSAVMAAAAIWAGYQFLVNS